MSEIRSKTFENLLKRWWEGTLDKKALVSAVEAMFETAEADASESARKQFAKDIKRVLMEGPGCGGSLGGCTAPLAAA